MVRRTAQRDAIRRVLEEAGRPLAPPEILKLAKRFVPHLGLTTVYRAVNALVSQGSLTPVKLPGEPPRFELAGKPPHDFFRCRVCRLVFSVPAAKPRTEGLPAGFVIETHHLLLEGSCRNCATQTSAAPSPRAAHAPRRSHPEALGEAEAG